MSYNIDFSGQVALVTGAAAGIGKSIAAYLTQAGAQVVIIDVVPPERCEAVQDELAKLGPRPHYIRCDISNEEMVKAAIAETVEAYGRLDMLVNNASIVANFQKSHDVNTMGTYHCLIHSLPELEKVKGRVVNITSASVFSGGTGYPEYNVTKAGIYALTLFYARNWASKGIRVNGIAPAVIMTDMMEKRFGSREAVLEHYKDIMPLGRVGYPEDIAGTVLFLLSPLSDWITGEVIFADGGRMHIG